MAKLEIPVVIDGVKSIEELANRVLDEYEFKGRTIREWADRIANPETNGDRLRSMTDEELEGWLTAFFCSNVAPHATARGAAKKGRLLEWLKQEDE